MVVVVVVAGRAAGVFKCVPSPLLPRARLKMPPPPRAGMDDPAAAARGTLESRYDARVRELLATDPAAAVDYMLRAAPLIAEYCAGTDAAPPAAHRHTGGLDAFGITVTATQSRSEVFGRYMAEMEGDDSYVRAAAPKGTRGRGVATADWLCAECGASVLFDQTQAARVCPGCGVVTQHMELNHHNLSFNEQVAMDVSSNCPYKRVNHFSEWINSLQARESTVIPEEVLDAVRAEFKKTRNVTRADITPPAIKAHLKRLRLSRWYEHTHAICVALNGTPAPTLSPALEARLKTMFHEIQAPFDKWRPIVAPKRKNFLSYAYTLYKMCELLGEDDLLKNFDLLKSQNKLYQMDAIWKKITAELRWEFIPSM